MNPGNFPSALGLGARMLYFRSVGPPWCWDDHTPASDTSPSSASTSSPRISCFRLRCSLSQLGSVSSPSGQAPWSLRRLRTSGRYWPSWACLACRGLGGDASSARGLWPWMWDREWLSLWRRSRRDLGWGWNGRLDSRRGCWNHLRDGRHDTRETVLISKRIPNARETHIHGARRCLRYHESLFDHPWASVLCPRHPSQWQVQPLFAPQEVSRWVVELPGQTTWFPRHWEDHLSTRQTELWAIRKCSGLFWHRLSLLPHICKGHRCSNQARMRTKIVSEVPSEST